MRSTVFARDEKGAVAIEFGIIAAALLLLFVAVVDLGMGFHRKMQVQSAAQRGGIHATVRGFTAASVTSVITSSRGSPLAAPAPRQFCGCPTTAGVIESICTGTCAGGSAPGVYVSASAQAIYTPLLPYPAIASPLTFSATQIVRIR